MEPEKSILKEFLNGGWLVPLVGAAAMFARLLSGNSGLSLKQQFKRVITAAIAAGIAWFVLEQTDVSSLTKAITYGIIGVISIKISCNSLPRLTDTYGLRVYISFNR